MLNLDVRVTDCSWNCGFSCAISDALQSLRRGCTAVVSQARKKKNPTTVSNAGVMNDLSTMHVRMHEWSLVNSVRCVHYFCVEVHIDRLDSSYVMQALYKAVDKIKRLGRSQSSSILPILPMYKVSPMTTWKAIARQVATIVLCSLISRHEQEQHIDDIFWPASARAGSGDPEGGRRAACA